MTPAIKRQINVLKLKVNHLSVLAFVKILAQFEIHDLLVLVVIVKDQKIGDKNIPKVMKIEGFSTHCKLKLKLSFTSIKSFSFVSESL